MLRADHVRGDNIIHGSLVCSNSQCQLEFPIFDGIPVLTTDPRTTLRAQSSAILHRQDLYAASRSLLGDALGQNSEFDSRRQLLSIYAWDGYAEFADKHTPQTSAAVEILNEGLDQIAINGSVLDLGCSVGRTTFELATRTEKPVLGIDLSFSMLQLAYQVLETSTATFDVKQNGLIYQEVEAQTPFLRMDNVDFWMCDALALPFENAQFDVISSLNLIDCVPSPVNLLEGVSSNLLSGGHGILSTPYDWSITATSEEAWIGGHSERGLTSQSPADVLRTFLSKNSQPHAIPDLELVYENLHVPWRTRLHARATMEYDTHLIVARKGSC